MKLDPQSLFDLTGTCAVVTGASGWLGRTMTVTLASAGADTVAVARSREGLVEAFDDVPSSVRGRIHVEPCDVTSEAWPETIVTVAERFGRLDILVNNAHIGRGGSMRLADGGDYHEAIELAVVAAARGMNAARPGFEHSRAAGGRPCVVNVASMYGLVSPDPAMYDTEADRNPPDYGVAKAGLLQLTRYAATELGPAGVRVNALVPGPFPQQPEQMDPAFLERLTHRTVLGRYGSPGDLAAALLSLVTPTAAFTTGSTVVVDGGWTTT